MTLEPVLIDGEWRQASSPEGSFQAVSPATSELLQPRFPVSSFTDVEVAIEASLRTVDELQTVRPNQIADFLELFAGNIEDLADNLVHTASLETGLPEEPRLRLVELPRTTDQLLQAATAARDRSWCQAVIDTNLNIRSKYGPLGGPVIVFGPNNFPFAFNSVAGGDFAAAIASGNPIIAKANPGHPGTTKIFTEAAFAALLESGLPPSMIQLVYHFLPEDGIRLVSHPKVGATAFTGSKDAGLALKQAAENAGKLIYLEMSGVNPVFLLPGAIKERTEGIADEFSHSCTLGAGQFCTNPGLAILVDDTSAEVFINMLIESMESISPGILLSQRVCEDLSVGIEHFKVNGAKLLTGGGIISSPGYSFTNTLFSIAGADFVKNRQALQKEVFGPASLLVLAKDIQEMVLIASYLEGQLAGSIYSHSQKLDDDYYDEIEPILRQKVGRLINDKMPTGVAVSPAMSHGGPFPASGHPGFTSVGIPRSMVRFAALHSYDNVRSYRLPEELRDKNPTGKMWRYIDGEWTQS